MRYKRLVSVDGGYCEYHDETVGTVDTGRCQGLKANGEQCKNRAKYGVYCRCHQYYGTDGGPSTSAVAVRSDGRRRVS